MLAWLKVAKAEQGLSGQIKFKAERINKRNKQTSQVHFQGNKGVFEIEKQEIPAPDGEGQIL